MSKTASSILTPKQLGHLANALEVLKRIQREDLDDVVLSFGCPAELENFRHLLRRLKTESTNAVEHCAR